MEFLPGFEFIDGYHGMVVIVLRRQLAVDVLETGANISGVGNLDMDCLRRINDCHREGFGSLRVEEIFGSWVTCKAALDLLRDVSPHAWRGSLPPLEDLVRSADCDLTSQPYSTQSVVDGPLDHLLQRWSTPLRRQPSFTVQHDWEKARFSHERHLEAADLRISDGVPGSASAICEEHSKRPKQMRLASAVLRLNPIPSPTLRDDQFKDLSEVVAQGRREAIPLNGMHSGLD